MAALTSCFIIGFLDVFPGNFFYFHEGSLKPAVFCSLLGTLVLISVSVYLNKFTQKAFFKIWTLAWLFYALWLVMQISLESIQPNTFIRAANLWCIGTASIFLLWGAAISLDFQIKPVTFWLFVLFLIPWAYLGAISHGATIYTQVSVFGLLGIANWLVAKGFYKQRTEQPIKAGLTLLIAGFILWGIQLISLPLINQSGQSLSAASFFSASVIQLFIAISMIIFVLEQTKARELIAQSEAELFKNETNFIKKQFRLSKQRYQCLFEQAKEAIIITSTNNLQILEANPVAIRMFNLQDKNARLTDLLQPDEMTKQKNQTCHDWINWINRRQRFIIKTSPTQEYVLNCTASLINLDQHQAILVIMHDITQQAVLEARLNQAEKMSALAKMLSSLALELNNPLAIISGYLELIINHYEITEPLKANLIKAFKECERASQLVSKFISVSQQQIDFKPISLNSILKEVADPQKYATRPEQLEINLQLDETIPDIKGDYQSLLQAFTQIVKNALEAMAEIAQPGKLNIKSYANGSSVKVEIEDNACGIPSDLANKIFEPFFTTKDIGKGEGLGLTIAYRIIKDHNGQIILKNPGQEGACFLIEFPNPVAPNQQKDSTSSQIETIPEHANFTNAKILILDDEPSLADLLAQSLSLFGFSPVVCLKPLEALEHINKTKFDVIISDFYMPEMDGRQFYELATIHDPELKQRIILLTGDIINSNTKFFIEKNKCNYIVKPFQITQIEMKIKSILNQFGLRSQSNKN